MTQHTPSSQSPAESWRDKRIFTTGEAAAVCKVSQQTIIRCFDSGRLTGFRVPGSKFRRIPRDELIRFMKANNIPTDPLEHDRKRVLVVDDDERILAFFMDLFRSDGRFDARTASTGYDAGLLTERFRPDLIILDYMLPDINGNAVCRRIREDDKHRDIRIIVVSGVVNRDDVEKLYAAGADDFLQKPFKIDALVKRLVELVQRG